MMITDQMTTPWIASSNHSSLEKMTLFCFPYAGGSASIYRNWAEQLPVPVNVCPVQLPGRGSRIKEQSYTNVIPLVNDLAPSLLPLLKKPFAFFGHSMGALIGFELARKLRRDYGLMPIHLFFSGRRAPHIPDTDPLTYDLPEPEFIDELRRLKGTPEAVLEHPELMQLLLPLLRTDFEICQTYQYVQEEPLDCRLTVFGGLEDTGVRREHLEPWEDQVTGPFSLRMLPGDHFFLHASERTILQALARHLALLLSKLS